MVSKVYNKKDSHFDFEKRESIPKSKRSNSFFDFGKILSMSQSKRSQETLGISFGVIFSIILIVFFIIVAGIVIKSFLDTKKCAELGIFIDRFNSHVENTWNSQSYSGEFKGNLPKKINYICFANLSNSIKGDFENQGYDISLYEGRRANTFFYPMNEACEMPFNQIEHLDLERITKNNNPNCILVYEGRAILKIEKILTIDL
jgi:hypothetical protein